MHYIIRSLVVSGMLLCVLIFGGCNQQVAGTPDSGEQTVYLQITDDVGRSVVLHKKPERIVDLSTTYTYLIHEVGGRVVGRPITNIGPWPKDLKNIDEVGQLYNINIEKVLALKPDLVVGFYGMHEKWVPILEANHIPVILLKMQKYEEVLAKLKLIGEITGNTENASNLTTKIQSRVENVVQKLPPQGKKVALIHGTAKSVSTLLEDSIPGTVAQVLQLQNIASTTNTSKMGDTVPYSMEKLVAGDPDAILVSTMGDAAEIEKRMNDTLISNPAWSSLRAVQTGQVYYLPSQLFLTNPGARIDESVEYMAKLVYPEIYGSISK